MTDISELLGEARRLSEAATPAPWGFEAFPHRVDIDGPGGWANFRRGVDESFLQDMEPEEFEQAKADAAFIAWCREGVPALIAALEQAIDEIDDLTGTVMSVDGITGGNA